MLWFIHVTQTYTHSPPLLRTIDSTLSFWIGPTRVPQYPPTFLKSAIYVTPGRVRVILWHVTLICGMSFIFGVRLGSLNEGCPIDSGYPEGERSSRNLGGRGTKAPNPCFLPNSFLDCWVEESQLKKIGWMWREGVCLCVLRAGSHHSFPLFQIWVLRKVSNTHGRFYLPLPNVTSQTVIGPTRYTICFQFIVINPLTPNDI
jgi:hypothetical protein